jgi:flagellar biosynthesis/type III secretory pathway protein FliH
MEEGYRPRDAKEAKNIQRVKEQSFYEGYHNGLKEGYRRARMPEKCHCCHCREHGEWRR